MENASKALIIAGAILISILIISFGVIILGQGGDVIKNANMSDAEVQAFNGKFDGYEGTTVRGSNVKQLVKTVGNHDRTESDDSKKVVVQSGTAPKTQMSDSEIDAIAGDMVDKTGNENATIGSGSVYTVTCVYSTNSGLIRAIYVNKNS